MWLKALNKHNITHIMYIKIETVINLTNCGSKCRTNISYNTHNVHWGRDSYQFNKQLRRTHQHRFKCNWLCKLIISNKAPISKFFWFTVEPTLVNQAKIVRTSYVAFAFRHWYFGLRGVFLCLCVCVCMWVCVRVCVCVCFRRCLMVILAAPVFVKNEFWFVSICYFTP